MALEEISSSTFGSGVHVPERALEERFSSNPVSGPCTGKALGGDLLLDLRIWGPCTGMGLGGDISSKAHSVTWALLQGPFRYMESSPPPIPLRGLSSKAHSVTWSFLLQGPFRYVGSPPRPIPLHGVVSSKAHSVTWALLQGPFRYMEFSPPRPIPWALLQGPFRYMESSPPRPIPLRGLSSKAHSVTWSRLRNSAVKKKACKLVVSCCFPIVARPKTAVGPISRHRRNLLILPWICGRLVGRL